MQSYHQFLLEMVQHSVSALFLIQVTTWMTKLLKSLDTSDRRRILLKRGTSICLQHLSSLPCCEPQTTDYRSQEGEENDSDTLILSLLVGANEKGDEVLYSGIVDIGLNVNIRRYCMTPTSIFGLHSVRKLELPQYAVLHLTVNNSGTLRNSCDHPVETQTIQSHADHLPGSAAT